MRRFKHTLRILQFYQDHFPESISSLKYKKLEKKLYERRIRLSARLADQVIAFTYKDSMNDFLRDLSQEINNREALMVIYDLVDSIYKSETKSQIRTSKSRDQYQQKLAKQFKRQARKRYLRLEEALNEEARLRKLPPGTNLARAHCHLWKQYFDYSNSNKLNKLIMLSDTDFNLLVYQFAVDLALLARDHTRIQALDWEQFSYTGFSRDDLEKLMDDRHKHLQLLGLDNSASLEIIKKRYKLLAKKHHPDQGGDPQMMRQLNIAYSCLIHEGERSF